MGCGLECIVIGGQVFAVVVVGLLGTLVYLKIRGNRKK